MSPKTVISLTGSVAIVLIIAIAIGIMYMSYNNKEVRLKNQFNAVQVDNQNQFDNMWKKISQVTQVTKSERDSVERIIKGYASEHSTKGAFINAVREMLPNIDSKTWLNLQNIVVSSRDRFTGNQTKLLDIKREHDNLLQTMPSSWFVGGREQLKAVIVTSDKTEDAFNTGKDNDVKLDL